MNNRCGVCAIILVVFWAIDCVLAVAFGQTKGPIAWLVLAIVALMKFNEFEKEYKQFLLKQTLGN